MNLAELKSKYRKVSSLEKAQTGWEEEYEVSSKQVCVLSKPFLCCEPALIFCVHVRFPMNPLLYYCVIDIYTEILGWLMTPLNFVLLDHAMYACKLTLFVF